MKRYIPNIKQVLFSLILVALFMPLKQKIFPARDEIPLKGKVVPAPDIEFSWDAWFSGEYQKTKGAYINENFGYRADFVRVYNEVLYSLYGRFSAPNIYEGKNGYLFRFYGAKYGFASDFRGMKYHRDRAKKLEIITKRLERQGITVVYSISPGKHWFHRDQLYERNKKGLYSDSTNYKCFRSALKSTNANWIDMNMYFENKRDSLDYPLYAKGGVHWTRQAAFEGMREIINYASEVSGENYPVVQWTKPVLQTWNMDIDITNSVNLIRKWDEFQNIQYSTLISNDSIEKPNALVISDSYFDCPFWAGIAQHYFSDDFNYWYYYTTSFNQEFVGSPVNKKKLLDEIKDRDVIIIMSTLMNLENPGWGFIDDVYEATNHLDE